MDDREKVAAEACIGLGASGETMQSFPTKEVKLGDLPVVRALPVRNRRLVGPWCFLDRFGPLAFSGDKPMDVAPHPHIGLQTLTWILEGEVAHDDSLGYEAVVRSGGVNVMTAGRGIAHAEQTPAQNSRRLNGVQLWIALPDGARNIDPSFEHVARAPVVELSAGIIQVFAGSLAGATCPTRHFSALVGADVTVQRGQRLELAIEPGYEHAVLLLDGECAMGDQPLLARQFYYLGTRRSALMLSSATGGRLLLIGGPPFPETILMWWNFVARTPEEISSARADWEAHRRFGEVTAYRGPRLSAPSLARLARPNPVS
jgi:redox-sensitive bicupin YhaK (pirin superfamily)